MRIFFLFLLIINVLIGIWFYLQPAKNNSAIQPMPDKLQQLVLLSEQGSQQLANPSANDAEVKSQQEAVTASKEPKFACYTLGPFKDEALLAQAKKKLVEHGLDIDVRKREESQQHRYWVYVPPLSSRAKAIEASKQLAQAKINDYYIVHSGENKNAVSLGHFIEKKHADRRVAKLKKHGFAAEMEVIYRQFDVFWLDYRVALDKLVDEASITEYQEEGVRRLDRRCK